MVTKTSQSGHVAYGLQEYVIDTVDDLNYLPIDALEYLYENTDKSDFVIGGVSCLCTCNQYIPEKYIWPGDSGVFLESQMLRLYCITAWGKLYNRKVVGSLRFNEHFTV